MAPKMIGAKESTEDGIPTLRREVEERPVMHWSFDVNQGGVYRSENADISSDSPDENSGYRKPKVSEATSIGFGSVESKGPANGQVPMYKSLIIDYFIFNVIT